MFFLIFVFGNLLFTDLSVGNKSNTKRLVLHSDGDVAATVQLLSTQMAELTAKVTATEQKLAEATSKLGSQGSTFVRWGRTICPNDTELVYKGFTAGGPHHQAGGTADYVCATHEPLWDSYDDAANSWSAYLYGGEYEFHQQYSDGGATFFGQNLAEHDAPCCLCSTNLPRTVMIPGRNQCYPGWTLQYSGYLVGGYASQPAPSNFACLDKRPETEDGDVRDDNGKLMYTVEAICGSLKCPPYVQYREITCAVCSK